MNTRGALPLVLCTGCMTTALAQAPSVAITTHAIVLQKDHVVVECDDQGTWTRVFVLESEPVNSPDAATVGAARTAALRRAIPWMSRFLDQHASVESVARGIEKANRTSESGQGRGDAPLSAEARRRLAAGLVDLRLAFSTAGAERLAVRSESGYDPDKSVAWGRRSVRNPAAPNTAVPLPQTSSGASSGEGRQGGVVGGVVGGLPQAPPSRAGARIAAPIQTYHIEPVFPAVAQSARVQGAVIVEALIGPDGKVGNARVVRSIPLLDAAALDAVRQWEWMPTKLNGVAVPVVVTVTVTFTLQ